MTEDQLRLISRLAKTQEGKDFKEEVLKPLLFQNHMDLLNEGRATRDEIVGFGNCLLFIINLFENVDSRLQEQNKTEAPDWT